MPYYGPLVEPEALAQKHLPNNPELHEFVINAVLEAQKDTMFSVGRLVGWDYNGAEHIADHIFAIAEEIKL